MTKYKIKIVPAPYPNTMGYDKAVNTIAALGERGYDLITVQHGLVYMKKTIDEEENQTEPQLRALSEPVISEHIEYMSEPELIPETAANDLSTIEKNTIFRTLKQYEWNRELAANELGISQRTLYRKLRYYNIDAPKSPTKKFSKQTEVLIKK